MFRNNKQGYGIISISLHWISAITILGLFGLGFWMVELTYYSRWYQRAPEIHKSIGLLLLLVTVVRLIWRQSNPKPVELSHKRWEQTVASWTHRALYLLLLLILVSGYLISTADGRPILVFDWFSVPSMGELFDEQADLAGLAHQYLAYTLIGLVVLHVLGALKHQFIDKDNTLLKIIKPKENR
ncbi:cytochrome b [Shewanella waksmanii]|uniref:cytochrome b n=1 Tax=Shewanella waksmanii TaxID=213783 RepID=UPI0037356067